MEFHINQEIVCIETHPSKAIKEGDLFTIQGLRQGFCSCNHVEINIGIARPKQIEQCSNCKKQTQGKDNIFWFRSSRFKPLDELVQINELLEVLEKPIFS